MSDAPGPGKARRAPAPDAAPDAAPARSRTAEQRPPRVQRTAPRKPAPPKPTAPPEAAGERLSKRVMQLKGCSRREAEQFIEAGWVRVDGVVVEEPPFRVDRQRVEIDPEASLLGLESVTLILHKPPGFLDGMEPLAAAPRTMPDRSRKERPVASARQLLTAAAHCPDDPENRPVLKAHLRHLEGLAPLETGAGGLVVFTQDWRVKRKLSEEMATMEHELVADVTGEVSDEALQRLARLFKDERRPLPQAKFSVNSSTPERSKLRFAIKGAHPGLIAYVCGEAGLQLLALRRIRLGRVVLSDLPQGQWRYLAGFERF